MLEGGDAADHVSAKLAPPGSSIVTSCGNLVDGRLAAVIDMESGRFEIKGLGSSGPTCELCVEERGAAFLHTGVGTVAGRLWRPFMSCNAAEGLAIQLVDFAAAGRAEPLLCAAVSAGRGDDKAQAQLVSMLPGRGGQPGPGIGDIQRVLPEDLAQGRGALFISGGAAATERNLQLIKVTAMLRLGGGFAGSPVPDGVVAKVISIGDDCSQDFGAHIAECNAFIEEHISSGHSVLVHCGAGVSRSGAAVVAYLMKTQSMSFAEALALARAAREWVRPNDAFQRQLLDFEKELHQPVKSKRD